MAGVLYHTSRTAQGMPQLQHACKGHIPLFTHFHPADQESQDSSAGDPRAPRHGSEAQGDRGAAGRAAAAGWVSDVVVVVVMAAVMVLACWYVATPLVSPSAFWQHKLHQGARGHTYSSEGAVRGAAQVDCILAMLP